MSASVRLDFSSGSLVAGPSSSAGIVRCDNLDIPPAPRVPLRVRQAERPTLAGRWALILADACRDMARWARL